MEVMGHRVEIKMPEPLNTRSSSKEKYGDCWHSVGNLEDVGRAKSSSGMKITRCADDQNIILFRVGPAHFITTTSHENYENQLQK